jgi:SAM-dependent methyltransferase
MAEADRTRLRATFDEAAERYDRARPGYPPAVFDDLAELAGVGPGRRVLEIGCGTGQATVPLAERGCQIVAVELGAGLAAVARRKLARFRLVQVAVAAFEDWPLSPDPFDVVLAATAFHWIDPAVRVAKAADALRPGGALVVISTHHLAGGDREFFTDVQACYEGWDPETTPPGLRLPTAAQVPMRGDELDRSGRFGPVAFGRHEWELSYSTAGYLELLRTYSGHIAMTPDARDGLFDLHRRPRRPPLRRAHHQALPDRAAGRARQALAVSGRRCRPGGRGRWRPARWRRSRRPVPRRRRPRPACRARRP